MSAKRRKIISNQELKQDNSSTFDSFTQVNIEKDILQKHLQEQKQLFESQILQLQHQNNTQQKQINDLLCQNQLFLSYLNNDTSNQSNTSKHYDYYS